MEPFSAQLRVVDRGGRGAGAAGDEGACLLAVEPDAAVVLPAGGAPALRVPFREVVRAEAAGGVLALVLDGGERVELSMLARRFDEAHRAVVEARREHLLRALLALERGAASTEAGAYRRRGAWLRAEGACAVRLQRTSLAVLPDAERPFVVAYGELLGTTFDPGEHALRLELDGGRSLDLFRLGKRTDAVRRELERLHAELSARSVRAVAALVPGAGAMALRRLGASLRDGAVAARADLDAAHPGAWDEIVSRSFAAGLRRDAVAHLAGRASAAFLCVKEVAGPGEPEDGGEAEAGAGATPAPTPADAPSAAAPSAAASAAAASAAASGAAPSAAPSASAPRALAAAATPAATAAPSTADDATPADAPAAEPPPLPPELAGRHVGFLFAIEAALVLEIPSALDAATYVFRAGGDAAARARELARGLAAIQFRREPIAASDAELAVGRLARYAEAAALVPELRALRRAYVGRAVHASLAAWRRRVDEAIAAAGS